MNLIDRILKFRRKERAIIEEAKATPVINQDVKARMAASNFGESLMGEFNTIKKVDDLLNVSVIIFNRDIHTSLTLPRIHWLDADRSLRVIFCKESCEPISAYFVGEGE